MVRFAPYLPLNSLRLRTFGEAGSEGFSHMKLRLLSFYAVFSVVASSGIYANPDPAVAALEATYQDIMEEVEQPLADLRAKYIESLEAWKLASQQKGDLQAVIAAQQEIDTVDLASERDFADWPELQRLRNIYETSLARLADDVNAERIKLQRPYRDRLQQEVERLTREGKLEEALHAASMVREISEVIDGKMAESGFALDGNSGRVLWEFTDQSSVESVEGAEMSVVAEGRQISSQRNDWSYFQSKRTFNPPFRLQARVSTDSNEIRLYYNADILSMFGWKSNPTELRLHEPTTGRKLAFRNKGQVTPGKTHSFEIDVYLDRVEVKVDGERRAVASVSSAGVDGAVGIGPAFGSVLTVEMMRVVELEAQ